MYGCLGLAYSSAVGATSTIFVEYLMEIAALDPDIEEDRRIATALMHGLSTDAWERYSASGSWGYRILTPEPHTERINADTSTPHRESRPGPIAGARPRLP